MCFAEKLISWYQANRRDLPWRRTSDPYHIWISEIMLQQTRVSAVVPYYLRFIRRLPDVPALAAVKDDELRKLWEGLGYYSRASNLKRAACCILSEFSGVFPSSEQDLLTLPGIGPYTAAAIASIAFGRPAAAVDGNVLRVWSRLREDARDLTSASVRKEIKKTLESILPADNPGEFNSAMMELGALVCLPNGAPVCASCPVASFCGACGAGTVSCFPSPRQKPERRVIDKTVFILRMQNEAPLVCRREEKGLLGGLWQFPDLPSHISEFEFLSYLSSHGLRPEGEILQYAKKHIFTHQEWNMRVYCVSVSGSLPEGWFPLAEEMPLPTAYRTCLPE